VRPVSIIAAITVAVLAIASFSFLRHDVDSQENSLLQSDDNQLALVLNEAVSSLGTSLTSLGEVMTVTGNSPALFQSASKAIVASPGASVALVHTVNGTSTVVLAAGPRLAVGQPLPGVVTSALTTASAKLSSTHVMTIDGEKYLGLLVSPTPGTAIVQLSPIAPGTKSANKSGPYSQLNFSLYASKHADSSQLVLGTNGLAPLPGPTAHTVTNIGDEKWLTVVSAKSSLVGSSPNTAPWIVLIAGLLIAVLIGAMSEILARRRDYAEELAAQRTLELTAAQEALVRRERLSAVGEMATVIGHELRNPLGAAINLLYLARTKLSDHEDPELYTYLDRLERETNRAASLCEDLTAYMRERDAVLVPLDLGGLVAEVLESTPAPEGVTVEQGPYGDSLQADRAQLVQILTNLITNAYQAMPDGGTVHVSGSEHDGSFDIAVDDSGPGIDPAVAHRLLEPFFTTKAVGTGLGLAIVKRFAEAHQGTVTIENRPTGGVRVMVSLPLSKVKVGV
jgi:signal transduction histidine kinase